MHRHLRKAGQAEEVNGGDGGADGVSFNLEKVENLRSSSKLKKRLIIFTEYD